MKKNIYIYIGAIVLVAALGTIFTQLGMQWFDGLEKPSEWIPSFIIPIVWTIIYLSFAVIGVIWLSEKNFLKENIILLVVNGALNVLWCLMFFTFKLLFVGNIIIIINTLFALRLWFEIAKQKAMYGYVLSIYPIWLCIATSLNVALWILN